MKKNPILILFINMGMKNIILQSIAIMTVGKELSGFIHLKMMGL